MSINPKTDTVGISTINISVTIRTTLVTVGQGQRQVSCSGKGKWILGKEEKFSTQVLCVK